MKPIGFGPIGERYAARLPDSSRVIASDSDGALLALQAAVEQRRSGVQFFAAPLVDDPRAAVAANLSGRWIEQFKSVDDRYARFDALASDRLADIASPTPHEAKSVDERQRRVLRDFAIMGDGLLVRSQRDVERLSRVLGRRRPHVVAAPGVDPTVPLVRHRIRKAVIVWAPDLDARSLGVIAMALDYKKCPVVYVCKSGMLKNARGDFIGIDDAVQALETASCVVDASTSDPGGAIALAGLGVPLVAAATSGAAEFVDGVYEYEPWDWRSVFGAVSASASGEPPKVKRDPVPHAEMTAVLARAAAAEVADEPLVSIVIPTYNRRHLLPSALGSLARQTYKNLEVVVVNNGGEDVSDIVAVHGFARVIDLPENVGPNGAAVVGLQGIRGEYFAFFNDDDEYFPDHLMRIVGAMERLGTMIGHTNTVTKYIAVEDGEHRVLAYRVIHDRTPDYLQMFVGGTMSIHSMLFRRGVLDAIGSLTPELGPADLEYQMRGAQRYDFLHVDVVTCVWEYRIDRQSHTHTEVVLEGLKEVFRRYPSPESAIVERRRASELGRFEDRSGAPLWPPDLMLREES